MRLCLPSMTMTPAAGAEALLWLSRQRPSSVDHTHKYLSRASITGCRYVDSEVISGSQQLSSEVWSQLEALAQTFTTNNY